MPDQSGRDRRNAAFLERYDGRLPELDSSTDAAALDGSGDGIAGATASGPEGTTRR